MNKKKGPCSYNIGVQCDGSDCSRCGWCPSVEERRLSNLRGPDALTAEKADKADKVCKTVDVKKIVQTEQKKKENKVHAEKTEDGYASKKEAKRAAELRLMEQAGQIKNLQEQKRFVLVPAIYETESGRLVKDWAEKPKKELERQYGKLKILERSLAYVSDFVYEQDGETIVEDVKGYKKSNAAVYRIFVAKRKLVLHMYGIRVREV